jgi:hypothetical protein
VGYFAFFLAGRYQARKAMWQNISLNETRGALDVIIITKEMKQSVDHTFTRLDKNEFRYKGKLYDIVRSRNVGTATYYYVINDIKEEHFYSYLTENIKSQLAQTKHPSKDQQYPLFDFLKQVLLTDKGILTVDNTFCSFFDGPKICYENPFQVIPYPPPKVPVFTV